MPESLPIPEFLARAAFLPVVDVRSPGEYAAGHIPGAVSLPLFSDEERAVVGTLYKQSGSAPAVLKALEYFGPKMAGFAREIRTIAPGSEVLVHCWRGGQRSGAMAWLFETAGIKAFTLQKGYKAYRNHVLGSFGRPVDLRVVGGETGSGKTDILHAIGRTGEQILDLEALARHRGSSFGALGQPGQPTVEQFGNDLFHALQQLDLSRPVWIEDESKSIGRVYIPNELWAIKVTAPVFRVRLPFEVRVQRLLKDYGHFPKNDLSEAVLRIRKRLGGLATQQALEAVESGDIAEMIRLVLHYYDKAYDFPHSDRKYEGVYFIDSGTGDPERNAQLVLQAAEQHTIKLSSW